MSEKKMWGGRFARTTHAQTEAYTESVSFDRRLWREDIAGSRAHARALVRAGVLDADEAARIEAGLDTVAAEIEAGQFVWRADLEDVHMNIEARLTEMAGDLGRKLHTGRSRNDQVALDFRLHVAARLGVWQELLADLVGTLAQRADEHALTLLPGCTHLQPAQPVSLAHHLLAYCWMFKRDHERVGDCLKRVKVSPLGAAALAGTTYPLDPEATARDLGFAKVFDNSMDAVSDRDFAVEALACASLIAVHLSRLCEELVIWANPALGFVDLPDDFATGSSIMPQKKNPDVAEIMRAKTGRVFGSLMGLLTVLKGLPLTYNRDLQEDKEGFFDTDETIAASLSLMSAMMADMGFDARAMRAAVKRGFLNATELADYLVGKGMPFRKAHHVTGRAVAHAESSDKGLEDLSLDEFKEFSPLIEADVYEVLDYDACVAGRSARGGTGPDSVTRQVEAVREWLQGGL